MTDPEFLLATQIARKAIDYEFKLMSVADLEEFSTLIRDAVVSKCALSERFSSIRLKSATLKYNDFLHKNLRGEAKTSNAGDGIEIRQTENAIQLAGTVVHELGHVMVGGTEGHSPNWNDACSALGLTVTAHSGQHYKPQDFAPDILHAIEDAILRFSKIHPELVYDADAEIVFPPGREPMAFQIDGIRSMLKIDGKKGILLADEMGLGKTVEVMGYINVTHPKRILIGCPNNAKLIWKRHFEEWCIHDYEVEVAHSNLYMFGDIVIMNYEAITKWADALRSQEWDLVVYDEGHYLKTPSAKRSKACYSIRGAKAIIVTGTPIVNYPYELFPLIHYLDRENWPEYGRFEASYGSKGSDRLGRNLNRLNSLLRSTIMVRRLKKDVMSELPKKRRQIVEFEVADDVRALIEEEKKIFQGIDAAGNTEAVIALNALRNDSEIATEDIDWAAIIDTLKYTKRYAFEEMAKIAHKIALAKLPLVIEHIENALEAREKVIVFGHHRDVLGKIHEKFRDSSVLLLGGNTNQAEVTAMAAQRFNEDEKCRVFIAGVQLAQGYSLQGSSTVIFVEEDWVPGIMTQAEDRAHGIGRGDSEAKSMLIQHLVFEDSLDTYKAKLTIRKQKSIDRAMNRF